MRQTDKRIKKRTRLALIITAVVICLSCFATATFAWYTANAFKVENSITAGYYYMQSLTVKDVGELKQVTVGSANETIVPYYANATSVDVVEEETATVKGVDNDDNGVDDTAVVYREVTLEAGRIYRVTFDMAGSSKIAGFGKVEGQGQAHYTHPMKSGEEYTVEFRPAVSGEYVITTCWGESNAKVTLHNYTDWSVTSGGVGPNKEHWHECTYDADGDTFADCDYEVDRAYHFYDKWNYTSTGEKSAYAKGHSHTCACGSTFDEHPVMHFTVYTKPLFKTAEATPLANTSITFVNQGSSDFTNEGVTDSHGNISLELGEYPNSSNGGTFIVNVTSPNANYYNGFTTFTMVKGVPTLTMPGYDEQYWIESAGGNVYNLYIAEVVLSDQHASSWEVIEPEVNGDGYYTYSRYSKTADAQAHLRLDGTVYQDNTGYFLSETSSFIDTEKANVLSFTINGPINGKDDYFPGIFLFVDGFKNGNTPVITERYFQLCYWDGKLSFKDVDTNQCLENSPSGIWFDDSTTGAYYNFDMRLVMCDNYISLYARKVGESEFVRVVDPYQVLANQNDDSPYSSLTYVGTTEILDVTFAYVEDTTNHVDWSFSKFQLNTIEPSTLLIGDVIVKNEKGKNITVSGNGLSSLTINGDSTSTSFAPNKVVNVVANTVATGEYQYVVTEMRIFGAGLPEEGLVIEHVGDANFNSTATIINEYFDDTLNGNTSSSEYTLEVTVTQKSFGANVNLTVYGKDLFNDEKQLLAGKTFTITGNGVTLTKTSDDGILALANLKTGEYTVTYKDATYGTYEYTFTLTAEGTEEQKILYTLTVDNVLETERKVVTDEVDVQNISTPNLTCDGIVLQHIPFMEIGSTHFNENTIQGDKFVYIDANGNKYEDDLNGFDPRVDLEEINYGNLTFNDVSYPGEIYADGSIWMTFVPEIAGRVKYVEFTAHNPSDKFDTRWQGYYDTFDIGGISTFLKDYETGRYISMGLSLTKKNGVVNWNVRVGHSIWYVRAFTPEQERLINSADGLRVGVGFDNYGIYVYFTDANGQRQCAIWRENLYEDKVGDTWNPIVFDAFDSIVTHVKDDYVTGLRFYESLPNINEPHVTTSNGTVVTNADDTVVTNADDGTLAISSNLTITVTPNAGYEVDRIYLDGVDVTTEFVNNTATFERYKHIDVNIVVKYRQTNEKTPITFEVWGQVGSNTYAKLDNEILFFTKSSTTPTKSELTEDMDFLVNTEIDAGRSLVYVPKNLSGVYYANVKGYQPVTLTFISGKVSTTRLEFKSTIQSTTVVDGMTVGYTRNTGMDSGLTFKSSIDKASVTFDDQLFDANNARVEFTFIGEVKQHANYSISLRFKTIWGKIATYQIVVWSNAQMPNGGIILKDADRNETKIIYANPNGVTGGNISFKFSMRINEHAYVTKLTNINVVDANDKSKQITKTYDYTTKKDADLSATLVQEGRFVASINGLIVEYNNDSANLKDWTIDEFRLNAQKLIITAGDIADVEIIPVEQENSEWVENGEEDTILFHEAKVIFTLSPNVVLNGTENINAVTFVNDAVGIKERNRLGTSVFIDDLGVEHTYVFEKTADNTYELTVFYYDSIVNMFYADFELQVDLDITITARSNGQLYALGDMKKDTEVYKDASGNVIMQDYVYSDGTIEKNEPYKLKPYVELRGRALGNVYKRYFNSGKKEHTGAYHPASDLTTIHFDDVVADTYDVTLFWDHDAGTITAGKSYDTPNIYSKGITEYLDTYLTIDYRPSYDLIFDYITFRYREDHMFNQTHINEGEGYYEFIQPVPDTTVATSTNGYNAYKVSWMYSPTNMNYPSNYYAEMNIIDPEIYNPENARHWLDTLGHSDKVKCDIAGMVLKVNIYDSDGYKSALTAGLVYYNDVKDNDKDGKPDNIIDYDGDGTIDNPGWLLRWGQGPWTTFALTQAQWELFHSTGGLKIAVAQNTAKDTVFFYADDGTGKLVLLDDMTMTEVIAYRKWTGTASDYYFNGVCEIGTNMHSYGTGVILPEGTNAVKQDGTPVYISGGQVYSDAECTNRLGRFGVEYASNTYYSIITDNYTYERLYFPEGTIFTGEPGALDGFKDLVFYTRVGDLADLDIDIKYVDANGNDVPNGIYANGKVDVSAVFMNESYVYAYAEAGYYLTSLKVNGVSYPIDYTHNNNDYTQNNVGYCIIPICYEMELVVEAQFGVAEDDTIYVSDAIVNSTSKYNRNFNGQVTITVGNVVRTYNVVNSQFKYRVGELPNTTDGATLSVTSVYHTKTMELVSVDGSSTAFTIQNGKITTKYFRINIPNVETYTNTTVKYYTTPALQTVQNGGSGYSIALGSRGGVDITMANNATTGGVVPFIEKLDQYRDEYKTIVKFRLTVTHTVDNMQTYPSISFKATPTKTGNLITTRSPRVQFCCWNGRWQLKNWSLADINNGFSTEYFTSVLPKGTKVEIFTTIILEGDTVTMYATEGDDIDGDAINWEQTKTATDAENVVVTAYKNSNGTASKLHFTGVTVDALSFSIERGTQPYPEHCLKDITVRREYLDKEDRVAYPKALDVFKGYSVDLLPLGEKVTFTGTTSTSTYYTNGEDYYNSPKVTITDDSTGKVTSDLVFVDKRTHGQIYCKSNATEGNYTATIVQDGITYTTKVTVGSSEDLYWDNNNKQELYDDILEEKLQNLEDFKYDPGQLVLFMGDSFLDEISFFKGFNARFQNMNAFSVSISSTTAANWYYFGQRIFKYQPKAIVMSMGQMEIWDEQRFHPYNGQDFTHTYTYNDTSLGKYVTKTHTGVADERPANKTEQNSTTVAYRIINTLEHYHRNMPNTTIYLQNILLRSFGGYDTSGKEIQTGTTRINDIVRNHFSGSTWLKYSDARAAIDKKNECYDDGGTHLSDNEGYDEYIYALKQVGFSYGKAGNVLTPNSKAKNKAEMVAPRTTTVEDDFTSAKKDIPATAGTYLFTTKITVHDYLSKSETSNNVVGHISINFEGTNLRFLLFSGDDNSTYHFGAGYKYPLEGKPDNKIQENYSKRYMTIPKGMDTEIDMAILSHYDDSTDKYNIYWFVNGELVRVLVNVDNVNEIEIASEWMSITIADVMVARPEVKMTNHQDLIRYPEVNVVKFNSYLDRALMWRNGLDLGEKTIAMDPNAQGNPQSYTLADGNWRGHTLYENGSAIPDTFTFEFDAFFSEARPKADNKSSHIGFAFNSYTNTESWHTRILLGDNTQNVYTDGKLKYLTQFLGYYEYAWLSDETIDVNPYDHDGKADTADIYREYRFRFTVLINQLPGYTEIFLLQQNSDSSAYSLKAYIKAMDYKLTDVAFGIQSLEGYTTAPVVRFPGEPLYDKVYRYAYNSIVGKQLESNKY